MFSFFKKNFDNVDKLYNKILNISRNKFFFSEVGIKDDYESKIYLIFYHAVFLIDRI